MNTQKGFVSILLILLGLVVVVGGVYVYRQNKIAENNINTNIEDSSSTEATTTVVVDASKSKISVIDQEQLNNGAVEKYANTAGINKQIQARAQASFSSFVIEASIIQSSEGSYKNVCANAKTFIEADIKKNLAEDDGLMSSLGITLNSYNINQIVCMADTDNFIITMPINLEDGTASKVCSTASQLGFVGDANYETYTCIKK